MSTPVFTPAPEKKPVRFFGGPKWLQIALAVVTLGFWLLVPLTIWLWRTGRRVPAGIVGTLGVLFVTLAAVSSFNSSPSSAPTASPAPAAPAQPAPAAPAPKPAAPAPKPAAPAPKPDATVDLHTRAYIGQVQTCQISVGLLLLDIRGGQADSLKLADEATSARDTCNSVRDNLSVANTDHFDNQATTAWYGVDRYKSGLNAFLTYLDTSAPTKLIEARNKLSEGDQSAAQGIRQINQRRTVYHLKPIKG